MAAKLVCVVALFMAVIPALGAGQERAPGVSTAIAASVPAPLYRDPVYDGAADPVLVWNAKERAWWMLYTQRRAKLDLPGYEWAHGTEIGVAVSQDEGMTWRYRGTSALAHPDAGYSFWAPDVVRDDAGHYHLFVSYVPGKANIGKHADVVVCGERAYIIYFTHPNAQDCPPKNDVVPLAVRRTSLQAAALEIKEDRLVCDRDKPFRMQLTPPAAK